MISWAWAWCVIDFLDKYNGAVTAVATVFIGVFTFVLACVTHRQARLTKEALIADKRAFVFTTDFAKLWEHGDSAGVYNWRFRPLWNNSGDTPTKDLTQFTACEIRNTMLPDGFDFNPAGIRPGTGLLPPKSQLTGGQAPTPPQAAISPQDVEDSQAGRKFIYLWGWARYSDVFPETKQHITRFCWLIVATGGPKTFDPSISGDPPTPGALRFQFILHHEGNCADDECD